jgi:hypothetical protein
MFDPHVPARLSKLDWTLTLAPSARRAPLAWVVDELVLAWQSAQREAVDAYVAWSGSHTAEAYAAYRAAQDRADAAQNTLAERSRGLR